MKTRPRRLHDLLLTLAAVALTTAGCHMTGPSDPTPPSNTVKAAQVLQSLPSLEDTQNQVQAAVADIKTAVDRLIPAITWWTATEGSGLRSDCMTPYEQSMGERFNLPDEVARNVEVSEEQWAKIQEAARAAAAPLEATEIQVMQDRPGFHDIGFYGPAGLFIKVAYHGNLVISGYTGCRLPRDKK